MFKIFSNINYYKDYYDKNFQINLDIQKIEEIEEEKEKETYYNNIAKISHFQEKLERSLGKLVKNLRLKNPDKSKKDLFNYLNNRQAIILNLAIGKDKTNLMNSDENGIKLIIYEKDILLKKKPTSNSINLFSTDSKQNESNEKKNNSIIVQSINQPFLNHIYNDNELSYLKDSQIFTLHVPLVIFNMRESLFINKKELWISDINCSNYTSSKYFEKVKINLNNISNVETMCFNSIELAFNSYFIESINYFVHAGENNESENFNVDDFSDNFPFNLSYNTSRTLCLNKTFSQTTFFYEDLEKIRNYYKTAFKKYYRDDEKFSNFEIYIKYIKTKIFLPPNSKVFNLLNKMDYHSRYFEKSNKNRFQIFKHSDVELQNKFALYEIKILRRFNLSNHKIKIRIENVKFKIFNEKSNSNDNFMFFLDLTEINLNENIENSNNSRRNIEILSQISIDDVNFVFSIPFKVKSPERKELIINELPKIDFTKMYEKMSNDENKLVILNLKNIKYQVLKKKQELKKQQRWQKI